LYRLRWVTAESRVIVRIQVKHDESYMEWLEGAVVGGDDGMEGEADHKTPPLCISDQTIAPEYNKLHSV
jgi:hypothetical protein